MLRPDFFVVSGMQGLKKFYVRAQLKDNEVRGMTMLYDQAMEGIMEPVVVAMSSAFAPFGDGAATPVDRGARSNTRTGIVVSKTGHIVTDAQATEGCQSSSLPGVGNAERVAEDKASELALLRIYGARDLKPLALSAQPPQSAELTLVGIADPQVQAGGSAVTTVKAQAARRERRRVTLEPAPRRDSPAPPRSTAQGQFVGMVDVEPQCRRPGDRAAGRRSSPPPRSGNSWKRRASRRRSAAPRSMPPRRRSCA